ncbi:MAG: acyl-CoA thioesterase [Pseudomonadales bacterium]
MQPFTITLTPRLYETDVMGHINNASIAAWFEVVRVRFLESLVDGGPAHGKNWTLASVHIDFRGETFYGEDVIASITEAKVGRTSLTLDCAMAQGERQTVEGRAVMVQWDPETRKPCAVDETLREKISGLG